MEKLLCPDPLTDGADLPEQWKRYKRNFTLFLTAAEKTDADDAVKVAYLLRTIGARGVDIYDSFTWTNAADKNVYATVLDKFEEFCAPRVNTVALTHKLLTTRQGRMTIDEYVTELHNIARNCDFQTMYERMVLQALILEVESDRTRRRMFEKTDLTLTDALNICRSHEAASRELKALDARNRDDEELRYAKANKRDAKYKPSPSVGAAKCSRCGSPHAPRSCPAYGKECHLCGKMNHFAKLCSSKKQSRGNDSRKFHKKEEAHQTTEWNYSSDSDEHSNSISVSKMDRKLLSVLNIKAGDVARNIEFQLDTGATCNILSTKDYHLLGRPKLEPTNATITCYNETNSTPLGWCYLETRDSQENKITLKFLVLDVKQHSLLSMSTCLEMQLLHVAESVHLTMHEDLDALFTEFEDVFDGLGELPGEYEIEIDPEVRPVQVRPRKIPLTMKSEVEAELI